MILVIVMDFYLEVLRMRIFTEVRPFLLVCILPTVYLRWRWIRPVIRIGILTAR